MSSFRRERARKRRRFLARAGMFLLVVAGLAVLGWSAYQSGTLLAEGEVRTLQREVDALQKQLEGQRSENAQLQADLGSARRANAALQSRYDSDVPRGDQANLLKLVQDRLTQGLPPDRLAQVVKLAAPVRSCEGRFERRRFAITAPGHAPEDPAALLDGLIQVSAAGADAKNAVATVNIAWAPDPVKLTGLPARQDVTINNLVLKLAVEPSDLSGYATATLSLCGKG